MVAGNFISGGENSFSVFIRSPIKSAAIGSIARGAREHVKARNNGATISETML